MKLGELKVACIKLMFDNDIQVLDPDTISEDSTYANRIVNIIESINRGLTEVAKAEKLPKKSVTCTVEMGSVGDYLVRYDLDTLVVSGFDNDVLKVVKIAYEFEDEYNPNVPIRKEGHNVLILPNLAVINSYSNLASFPTTGNYMEVYKALDTGLFYEYLNSTYTALDNTHFGKYIITYSPTYSNRFSYDDLDTEVITDIPDDVLDILPYFVKGDLFEEDDPQSSVLATNKFHSYLAQKTEEKNERVSAVKNIYTQVW